MTPVIAALRGLIGVVLDARPLRTWIRARRAARGRKPILTPTSDAVVDAATGVLLDDIQRRASGKGKGK